MTYGLIKRIALGIIRMALFGILCQFLYSTLGIGVLFLFLGIALVIGLFYFLAMCIAAGLENKFGEFDRFMWRKPRQLTSIQKLLPCK